MKIRILKDSGFVPGVGTPKKGDIIDVDDTTGKKLIYSNIATGVFKTINVSRETSEKGG